MSKLNQIIAVCSGKKSNVEKAVTAIYQRIQKPELFSGLSRTYQPTDDGGESLPSEVKFPQAKVQESIVSAVDAWSELFDIVLTQDTANTKAKANLTVNGVNLINDVPVTHLLFLEKQLTDVQTFVSKLPVLDPSEQWNFDSNANYFKTDVVKTNRNVKKPKAFVKAEATDKHPAQVDVFTEDVKVGEWNTVKFSGCIDNKYKEEVLNRIRVLIEAVKEAREEANSLEVQKQESAKTLFKYIFG